VITDVVAIQHDAGEPAGRVVENGQSVRAGVPSAASEFVGFIARLPAEQQGELAALALDQVHRTMVGVRGYPICVIALGQSDEGSRRVDTDLACEADQAASRLLSSPSGDDRHRIVDQGNQLPERCGDRFVARVVGWPKSMRPRMWSVCPT
jgi:hypothetical protein